MIEKEWLSLQGTIESLISSYDRLTKENIELRKSLVAAQQKNTLLLDKNLEAFKRLKALLLQVKEGAL